MRVAPDKELMAMHDDIYMPMLQTAEIVGDRYGITREQCDEYALKSQQLHRGGAGTPAGSTTRSLKSPLRWA